MKNVILATLLLAPITHAAQPVTDPFPEKIKKGEVRIELKEAAIGLTAPVWGTHAGDGSGRLFIVDQVGVIYVLKDGRKLERPFLDVRDKLVKLQESFDERGLLGLAFHPGFGSVGDLGYRKLYTYTNEPVGDHPVDFPLANDPDTPTDCLSVISEWTISDKNPDVVDPASRRVVMTYAQPQFNHKGGCILFDKGRLLYIGTGDGGAGNDLAPGHATEGNGQNLLTPLGKVLRIDPMGLLGKRVHNGRYSVPTENPYIGRPGLDEIYAYGMRNPWRMSFDRATGKLIAADVGQNKIEEIDEIILGGNYGWPIKEGSFFFVRGLTNPLNGTITTAAPGGELPKLIDPVAQYDHDEGISITGGFVYRGKAIPALQGQYVFADWVRPEKDAPSGRLLYADLKTGLVQELTIGADDRPLGALVIGFGEDQDGEVYALTTKGRGPKGDTGVAWKIVP